MLLEHYHALYQHEEYERKIQALQLERRALAARAARNDAMANLVGRGLRWVTGLGMTTWRWVRSTLSQARWTQPLPNKPYSKPSN
jgi:hypothetical protein